MRIALCLSGEPRDMLYTALFIEKLKSLYDVDIFIHTWYVNKQNGFNDMLNFNIDNTLTEKRILKYYKPINYIIENQFIENRVESMYYSIFKSNELKKKYECENDFVYDIVIRSRFDLLFDIQNLIANDVSNRCVYVNWISVDGTGVDDTFSLSNSHIANIYANAYNFIKNNQETHTFLNKYLKTNNISIKINEKYAELTREKFKYYNKLC